MLKVGYRNWWQRIGAGRLLVVVLVLTLALTVSAVSPLTAWAHPVDSLLKQPYRIADYTATTGDYDCSELLALAVIVHDAQGNTYEGGLGEACAAGVAVVWYGPGE